jgi:hypothetical protein
MRTLITELHSQLMAFHRAGQKMADTEVKLMEASAKAKMADAKKAETQLNRMRAVVTDGPGAPISSDPKHGGGGHERVPIHSLKSWIDKDEPKHANT